MQPKQSQMPTALQKLEFLPVILIAMFSLLFDSRSPQPYGRRSSIVVCYAVYSVRQLPTFRKLHVGDCLVKQKRM